MNFRCLSIMLCGWLLFSPTSSVGITPFTKPSNQPSENNPYSPNNLATSSIQLLNGQIVLVDRLQDELEEEINQAKKELSKLSQNLSLDFGEEIGITYIHKGQNCWSIKFTFGGLILPLSEEIIFSAKQVLTLKEFFQQTEWIEIKGKKYPTTGWMRQLGPMLHS